MALSVHSWHSIRLSAYGGGAVWGGGGGWVKIISSNDIMCHVHSHPPSHHIGKILDGQSLITGKRVLVVHNTHRKQKNLQARNPCSIQDAKSQNAIVSTRVFAPNCPDPVWCHRLSLRSFSSNRMRTPTLAGAPRPRISDTVCLSAVIGPVLLFVKMCFWPYGIVFKSPRRPNLDREGRCNK